MKTLRSIVPLALAAVPFAGGIEWQSEYAGTLARAKAEGKVVFVAVNMDGERANDRMAEKVYTSKTITKLAEKTLSLVASNADHGSGDRPCPRFGKIPCADHRRVDISVREKVLKRDSSGYVIAPQHVFLDPEGAVILSVPYVVTEAELEWCFVTSLRAVDARSAPKMSSGARPPKRLIMGDVYDPAAAPEATGRPLTREEALELISEVKKGTLKGGQRDDALRRIMTADEREAIEFIRVTIRASAPRRSGGDRRGQMIHDVGVHSPRSYWDVIAEWTDHGEEVLRNEAAVALEQLAAPESLKVINAALKKERDPSIEKNWLRALGSAGAADKGARKTLLRAAEKEKDPVLRANAIVALGWLTAGEDVREVLTTLLGSEQPDHRTAAICATALSRDAAWIEPLAKALGATEDTGEKATLEAALAILRGEAGLANIREPLRRVARDELERERLFGRSDG